jgi:hypothetical protein
MTSPLMWSRAARIVFTVLACTGVVLLVRRGETVRLPHEEWWRYG